MLKNTYYLQSKFDFIKKPRQSNFENFEDIDACAAYILNIQSMLHWIYFLFGFFKSKSMKIKRPIFLGLLCEFEFYLAKAVYCYRKLHKGIVLLE